jgi:hypothetical protein
MDELAHHTVGASEAIMSFGSVLMEFSALLNSTKQLVASFFDPDVDGLEKLGNIISFLTTAIFTFTSTTRAASDIVTFFSIKNK